jgi:hypothetical protein
MTRSSSASRTRKNKARLTVSYPFAPASTEADIGIEPISSGATLLPDEFPLCPLYAEGSIDIALNALDKFEVLENTR